MDNLTKQKIFRMTMKQKKIKDTRNNYYKDLFEVLERVTFKIRGNEPSFKLTDPFIIPDFDIKFGGWDSKYDNINDNEFIDESNKLKEFEDHYSSNWEHNKQ